MTELGDFVDSTLTRAVIGGYTAAHAKGIMNEDNFILNEHLNLQHTDQFPQHPYWKNNEAGVVAGSFKFPGNCIHIFINRGVLHNYFVLFKDALLRHMTYALNTQVQQAVLFLRDLVIATRPL